MDNYNNVSLCGIHREIVTLLSLVRPDFCPDDIKIGYYAGEGRQKPMTAVICEDHGARLYPGNIYRMPYAERMRLVEDAVGWLSMIG